VPKRRREWLLGRWTAKQLLAAYLGEEGSAPPLDEITIANDPTGAPYAYFDRSPSQSEPDRRIPVSLTISHSGEISLCALVAQRGGPRVSAHLPSVGGDVEQIEPRSPSLVRDFFTAEEQAALIAAPPHLRDALATAIWSAKEAALKALRLGLSVDTRQVTVRFGPDPALMQNEPRTGDHAAVAGEAKRLWLEPVARQYTFQGALTFQADVHPTSSAPAWTPVAITLSGEAAHAAAGCDNPYRLTAWQRLLTADTSHTQYVLTLCVLAQTEASEVAAAA